MATEELPAASLSARDRYRLMTDLIAPRPIAWVSTVSSRGVANLAPFSYFQGVCSDPPTIVLGIAWLVLTILAAVKANKGEFYRYPLTIRFF